MEKALRERWLDTAPSSYTKWTRDEALLAITSDNLLLIYLGIYLGITFLVTSGAVLALQQMSQATGNRKRYQMLKKLGVSGKDRKDSLKQQLAVYFFLPLAVAALHTLVTVSVIFHYNQGAGTAIIAGSVGFGALLFLSVYSVYFIASYLGSKRILQM